MKRYRLTIVYETEQTCPEAAQAEADLLLGNWRVDAMSVQVAEVVAAPVCVIPTETEHVEAARSFCPYCGHDQADQWLPYHCESPQYTRVTCTKCGREYRMVTHRRLTYDTMALTPPKEP